MLKTIFLGFLFAATSYTGSFSDNKDVNDQIIYQETDTCTMVASLAYNLAIREGADHPTAVAASNLAYKNCKKSESIEPAR